MDSNTYTPAAQDDLHEEVVCRLRAARAIAARAIDGGVDRTVALQGIAALLERAQGYLVAA